MVTECLHCHKQCIRVPSPLHCCQHFLFEFLRLAILTGVRKNYNVTLIYIFLVAEAFLSKLPIHINIWSTFLKTDKTNWELIFQSQLHCVKQLRKVSRFLWSIPFSQLVVCFAKERKDAQTRTPEKLAAITYTERQKSLCVLTVNGLTLCKIAHIFLYLPLEFCVFLAHWFSFPSLVWSQCD